MSTIINLMIYGLIICSIIYGLEVGKEEDGWK